jgi:hypothetical protein
MASIKIRDKVFEVNPLLVEDSFDLQPDLMPVLPEIGQLIALFFGDVSKFAALDKQDDAATSPEEKSDILRQFAEEGGAMLAKASPILGRISKALPADRLRHIRRTLLRDATCGGVQLYGTSPREGDAINVLLAGRVIDVWRLLLFAVQISYPDFFEMAASLGTLRARGANFAASIISKPNG